MAEIVLRGVEKTYPSGVRAVQAPPGQPHCPLDLAVDIRRLHFFDIESRRALDRPAELAVRA